jgi:hypothetical protein
MAVQLQIHWNHNPVVNNDFVAAAKSAVQGWINGQWHLWHDGQKIEHGMNVEHGSVILIGFHVTFTHGEGQAPLATITDCMQVHS